MKSGSTSLLNHEPEANFGDPYASLKHATAVLRYYIATGDERALDDFFNNRRIGEYGVYRTNEILCWHIGDDNSKGNV